MLDYKTYFPHYYNIKKHKHIPAYLKCKHIPVTFNENDSLKQLWRKHNRILSKKEQELNCLPDQSLLDLKVTIATRLYSNCVFCNHRCRIDRNKKIGQCHVKDTVISSAFLHWGEESFLVPSYAIFFSGCNLSCVFCQNYDISQHITGRRLSTTQLSDSINDQVSQKADNINWVGGDPTPHLLFILKTLQQLNTHLPQIWNSNMYCSPETMNLLNGIIDFYLTDFKFGSSICAQQLSGIADYVPIIQNNHILASQQTDLLIRHLLIPNHINCCTKPIIDFISKSIPHRPVNIMDQYQPCYKAELFPSINRAITAKEYKTAISYAKQHNIILIS